MMQSAQRWRPASIGLLTAVLAVVAAALLVGPLRDTGVAAIDVSIPWWALAPLFTAAELIVVHIQARRESMSISFAEVPMVLSLVFCAPTGHVAASVLGSAVGLLYHRQYGLKLPFNLALFALEAALAQLLYHSALGTSAPTSLRGFGAVLATIVVTQAVSAGVLTLVIYLKAGRYDDGVLSEAWTSGLVAALTNASVGLLVVVLAVTLPAALPLLLVVIATLIVAYRGYASLSLGHARLESLYRFTHRVGGAVRTEAVTEAVLSQARDVLAAGTAELILLPRAGAPGVRLRLAGERMQDLPYSPAPGAWWTPAQHGSPIRLSRGGDLAGDVRGGLAAPLLAEEIVVGVLIVTDRAAHLNAFSEADLRLFSSLASHASLSLHKAHLVDQLRAEAAAQEHHSLHDALTGLPNRRHFLAALDRELATDPYTGVLMLDLDGFKEINEALGHATGDLLLLDVGRRLAALVGEGMVARLGNDEFAVLLQHARDRATVKAQARAVVAALAAPFPLTDLSVDVVASAGLALAPDHGDRGTVLLQRADVALYTAKHDHTSLEIYDPASDRISARRLELTRALRDAVHERRLEVHYQPKVSPETGEVLGAEALVRWNHPVHGQVSPEEFIPLAEHSGLIHPLTSFVLDNALGDCVRWREQGHRAGVAVNLSTRSLSDQGLPRQVREALDRAGLPADVLTLEITETAVMSNLARSLEVLTALRDLGVRLSIDDFGTGQSSLAYLKALPVHEVKIDKSFVLSLTGDTSDDGDAAIVRAAIDLGHAMGLGVVAEGVEDNTTQEYLAGWGCDVIQGFHIARPMGAEEFHTWLNLHEPHLPVPRAPADDGARTPTGTAHR